MKSKVLLFAEIVMVAGAVIGSALVSLNIDVSKWGFVPFFVGSLAGLYVGIKTKINSITILNGYFSVVNMMGIIRWFA